jgi:hypothetical protein
MSEFLVNRINKLSSYRDVMNVYALRCFSETETEFIEMRCLLALKQFVWCIYRAPPPPPLVFTIRATRKVPCQRPQTIFSSCPMMNDKNQRSYLEVSIYYPVEHGFVLFHIL